MPKKPATTHLLEVLIELTRRGVIEWEKLSQSYTANLYLVFEHGTLTLTCGDSEEEHVAFHIGDGYDQLKQVIEAKQPTS